MKQKKSKKKKKLNKQISKQHLKAKESKSYVALTNFADIKQAITHNLDFLILLGFIIAFVYFNSLNGEFISDDIAAYIKNPETKNFWVALKTLRWQSVMYATLYSLFKLNPIPIHIMSVVLHFLSVGLFFLLISNFFNKKVSMISAVLFSVHPLASETVAWMSGSNYLMISIFTSLSAISYVIYRNSKMNKYFYYSMSLFIILIITTSTPQALTVFPVLVLLDQLLIENKINFQTLKKLALFLIPIFLYLLYYFTAVGDQIVGRVESLSSAGDTTYLVALPYSFYMPIRLMLFPDQLTLYHESEIINTVLFGEMWAVFILYVISVVYMWRRNRKIAGLLLIGPASYLYMLSPVQVAWFFAERYVYYSVGVFSVIIAAAFTKAEVTFKKKHLAIILTVLLASAYSARTFVRNKDWETRKTLWEATARVVPLSARTYNNLGDVYGKEKNIEASIRAFERAIELDDNYADANHNLGITYLRNNNYEMAEKYLLRAAELNPNLYQTQLNLGIVEFTKGNVTKAVEYVENALEINPNYMEAQNILEKITQN